MLERALARHMKEARVVVDFHNGKVDGTDSDPRICQGLLYKHASHWYIVVCL